MPLDSNKSVFKEKDESICYKMSFCLLTVPNVEDETIQMFYIMWQGLYKRITFTLCKIFNVRLHFPPHFDFEKSKKKNQLKL